ncbi:MAG: alpha/beta fold hydrolase, partial [Actinomycetota bacterium]
GAPRGRSDSRRVNRARTVCIVLTLCAACSSHPAVRAPVVTTVPDSTLSGAKAFEGPLRLARVGAGTLAFRQFGTGPALVMLLGDDSSITEWPAYLLQPLSSSFQVTVIDYPGIGRSTDDVSKPMTVPSLADTIAGFIGAIGLRQPAVLGWSFGGEVALALAVLHPGVARAVVTSGADAGSAHAVQADPAVVAKLYDPKTPPAELLGFLFPKGAPGADAYVSDYLATDQETVPDAALQRELAAERAFVGDARVYEGLPSIAVPVLVTNGTEDVLVPVANARILASRIPGARLQLFAHAGHGMLLQDAPGFAAAVRSFLTAG